ncbi:MAG: NAD-dependent succinate-semialdehyde dehydrogenase [Fidelibacterota bacterium]
MDVINPCTGELVRTYPEHTPEETEAIIQRVHETYREWKRTSFQERSGLMKNAARILRENTQDYAELMAVEMGKPVKEGRAEVEKCAWVCDFYADRAEEFLSSQIVLTEAHKSFVAYRPIGIVLAVMPWNFPFWQVLRFAAPALMAGNAGVLKHASNVPGSALAIEDVFRKAGFPEHIFRTLLIGSRQVAAVIENPLVKAVTLTGSTPAGKAVAAKAGEQLKKTVLELGGSDPYVILEDADVELAATTCSISRMINGGQSCIAAKRFVVVEAVREEFERLLLERMKTVVMGDPLQEETTLGPQAREDLRDELHDQVVKSIELGAKVLIGGEIPDGPGAFYPATVLTNVSKGMPAYDEELFGPVAAIIPVKDEVEALRVANDTIFGLGSAVFTRDVEKGERIAVEELEAGSAFVNAYVKSDPRLPFGGIKESGYGRELAANGIREFVNVKTVYVQ